MKMLQQRLSIEVREADLVSDRDALIEFLRQYLNPLSDQRRFDWLYLGNPWGVARAWLATESASREIVGMAAAFPRRFSVNRQTQHGWVLGDFCIHPARRSLGPALQIQRACLDGLGLGLEHGAIAYDFPSQGMLAIYRRLHTKPSLQITRLAKLLRAERYIGDRVGATVAARPLVTVANSLLRFRDRVVGKSGSYAIQKESKFSAEFTLLAGQAFQDTAIYVERQAEYLNWRYFDNPLRRHELLTARRNGQLAGYLVWSQNGEDAVIMDLLAAEATDVLPELLTEAFELLRRSNAAILSAPVSRSHPHYAILSRAGFHPRETCDVVTFGTTKSHDRSVTNWNDSWSLSDGDRDS
jgi:hypothetical protein